MNYMNARNCMPAMANQAARPNYNQNCSQTYNASCTPVKPNCSAEYPRECSMPEVPVSNQKQLFNFINEVSFASYETLLFLDTHPDDQEALSYFHKYNHLRNAALKEYAKRFEPLTISTADDCASKCWEWMNQPWPWEGGMC